MKRTTGFRAAATGLALAVVAGTVAVAPWSPMAGAADLAVAGQSAGQSADPIGLAVAAADKAAASGLDALRKGPNEQFDRKAVYTGGNPGKNTLYYVSYDRTYRGLPVVGGDAVVATDADGKVLSTVSGSNATLNLSTRPRISAAQATTAARAKLAKVDKTSDPKLVVLTLEQPQPVLAWHVVVSGATAAQPSRQNVYVDASSGTVAHAVEEIHAGTGTGVWSGPNLNIPTSGSSGNYKMQDPTRGNISCANYSGSAGSIYTDTDDVWGSSSKTDKVSGCVDVMYANAGEWDMLRDWLGRNGFNGNGGAWPSYVGLTEKNAYWDYVPNSALYGYNGSQQWLTQIDVVGHENGHGLDENTPGGTATGKGLGEATGDIFGALTEHYINSSVDTPDYATGELVNFNGDGKPLRYMYEPNKDGSSPNCWSSSVANLETHIAAGPLNHWFYLLAEGSAPGGGKPNSPTCNSSAPTGVGIQNAGKVFYNAMLLKTSSMTYQKYRIATLQAAKNLDSTCGLFNKTKGAWDAISLPAQSGETTCTSQPGNDFSLSLNPGSGNVQPGSSATTTVGTTTTSGSAQTVNLTASGLPSGATASFNPSSVQSGSSSTLTISTSGSTPTGSYSITVTGTGSQSHTATYNLTVGSNPGPGAPNIDVAKVQAHLTQFGTIAGQNGGNRRAGSAGYTQSVAYVKGKLQAAGYTVTEQNCSSCTYPSNNLIADWPGGDTNNTVMFGAHLDGVSAGPGINDNASGSGALLESALALAAANPTMTKHVRFGWWTDEEQGLNGSKFYVNSLSAAQKTAIKGYYNFDMIASKNAGYFINNVNTATSAPLKAYWDSLGLSPEENVEGQGRSDDASFKNAGILTSGYATGASAVKTTAQVTKWGGTRAAYDPCYHQSCDTTSNINATALDRGADGIAYAIWNLAVGTSTPTNDFSVSVNPASGNANRGSSVSATVNTVTTSGSAQTVNLSASGAPAGVTVGFSPSSVQSGSNSSVTFSVASNATPGTSTITITGAGSVTHTTTYTLTVNGATPTNDFSVSVNPSSGSANRGSSVSATLNTVTTSGSAQTVNLSASGAPSGVSVSFSPSSVQSGSNSTVTFSASSSATVGTYTITLTGSGSVVRSTSYSLTVNGTPPGGRTFTNGTDYQIRDNQIVSSIMSNASGAAVSPVTVSVTINHTCSEDLGMSLIAPSGMQYALKAPGSGNYPCTPFGGLRTYSVPINAAAAGIWRLGITDYGPGDYGVLDTWSITL